MKDEKTNAMDYSNLDDNLQQKFYEQTFQLKDITPRK